MPAPVYETYREWQAAARPAFHGGENGEAFSTALGLMKDATVEQARAARRQRWISRCSEDALAKHGKFRGWPRVAGESVAQYRARLLAWWRLAAKAGTAQVLIDAFALFGMTNVEIFESFTTGWGRHVGFAGARDRWFNVVIRHPHPFGTDFSFRYGDGTTYGSGKTYGVTGDASLFAALREIVTRLKPAHAFCEWIAIVLDGDIKHANLSTDGDPDTGAKVAYLPFI